MKDLHIKNSLYIPAHELEITSARAGGPGGQHVNKANTKVIIRWNIRASTALNEPEKERLQAKLASEITLDGDIVIQNGSTRSQVQNKKLALDQLIQKIRSALHVQKKRTKTKVPKEVKEKRLKAKKMRGVLKRMRDVKDY